jgi:hypothetical protein
MDARLLMTLQVAIAGPQKIGAVPHGTRTTVPIGGGQFEGPRLRGKVLPGGGDWTLLRADNRLLAVGTAEIRAEGPVHVIEELL